MNSEQSSNKENTMNIQHIMSLIPHRYPFLLIDRILDYIPNNKIIALKNVTLNEPYFQGHFPDFPIMPGVLIIEAMAQAGAAFVSLEAQNKDGITSLFRKIDKAKFRKPVFPGDQLKIEMVFVKKREPIWKFKGKATVENEIVVSAELDAAVTKK